MGWSTPVVARIGDRDELLYNGSKTVVSYDPETGKELWRAEGSSIEAIPMLVFGGGMIFSVSGRNGPILALRPGGNGDISSTHIAWSLPQGGAHVPSPVYVEGMLFMVNDMGIAMAIDAANGKTLWQKRLPGKFSMSPIEAGGKILVTNETGKTYILAASRKFEILAENDLDEVNLATPALVDGKLYFRTAEHLWAIGDSKRATAK